MKGIPRTAPRCALGKLLLTKVDPERVKREGWREQRILVVSIDDPRLDFVMRQMVQQLGDSLYGHP